MDRFEKQLRDRLAGKASSADMDTLWSDLEKRRNPKRKRRLVLLLLPLLFIGISATYFLQSNSNHKSSISAVETKSNASTASKTAVDSEQLKENNSHNTNMDSKPLNENNHNQSTLVTTTITNISSADKKPSTKKEATTSKKSVSISKASVISEPSQQKILLRHEDYTSKSKSVVNKTLFPTTAHNSKKKEQTDSPKLIKKMTLLQSLPMLSLLKNNIHYKTKNIELTNWNSKILPVEIQKKSHRSNTISLAFYSGLMKTDLGLANPQSAETLGELLALRENDESNLPTFGAQLSYTLPLSTNWFLETGIEYQRYTSNYAYNYSEVRTEFRQDTVSEIIVNGVSTITLDDVPVNVQENYEATRYLRYASLRIPLSLGYRVNLGRSTSFNLSAGVSYGFINFNDGNLRTDPKNNKFQSALNQEGYDKADLWGGLAKLTIEKDVTESLYISGGIQYQNDLSSRATDLSTYRHKSQSFNLALGMGIKL